MKRLLYFLPVLFFLSCSSPARVTPVVIDDQYSLDLPESMIPAHFNDNATLQYKDSVRELYVVALAEPKKTIAAHGLVYDLDLYSRIAMRRIDSTANDSAKFKPEPVTINGLKGLRGVFKRVELMGKKEPQEILREITIVESPTHFYQIEIWTLASWEKRNRADIDAIRNSFKEVTGNKSPQDSAPKTQ